MDATQAVGRLPEILDSLSARGYDTRPLVIDSPASPDQVDAVEGQLGCRLPASLRQCLTTVASRVEFAWFAPAGHSFPDPFHEVFSGNLCWSLHDLPDVMTAMQGWVDEVFPDPADPYDRVWHHKLPFMEVGNGDYLALDLDDGARGHVVYLSHDDGEGHGRTMATSFEELLIRWIPLACPGAEDWQWLPFCAEPDGGIDPTSAAARRWTALLHPDIDSPGAEGP